MTPKLIKLFLVSVETEKKSIEGTPTDGFHWRWENASPAQAKAMALADCEKRIRELKSMLAEDK